MNQPSKERMDYVLGKIECLALFGDAAAKGLEARRLEMVRQNHGWQAHALLFSLGAMALAYPILWRHVDILDDRGVIPVALMAIPVYALALLARPFVMGLKVNSLVRAADRYIRAYDQIHGTVPDAPQS